jgi:hypothetical protein
VVGRAPTCTLQIKEDRASREHARLCFTGEAWALYDLGSRNGTFVNGERVPPSTTRELAAGDVIAFGQGAASWTLTDAAPPVAVARRLDDQTLIAAENGILPLPSADNPVVTVLEGEGGAWLKEVDGQAKSARDSEVLDIGGVAFMLHLPAAVLPTVDAGPRRPGLPDIELRFRVSRDEENIEVAVAGPDGLRVLPARSHHYTWLTIARARLHDRDTPGLAEPQRGWAQVDDLCRALRIEETRLNVEIHRIRQDLAAAGLRDAASIIERRRGARQLRLGTARVAISAVG